MINPADQIFLVHASYSLPEWQAVKLTFAPCALCYSAITNKKQSEISLA